LLHWKQRGPELCLQDSTALQCNYNYVSHAIGMGIRYKTPIGPVRFDFGYNLNPPAFPSCQATASVANQAVSGFCPADAPFFKGQHAAHFNVYFSIGQTF
jgi:outer membrane protein assembly factor BamA